YGALAQTSVAGLFIAGIVPGILIGVFQMGYAYYYAKKYDIGEVDNELIGLPSDNKMSQKLALKKSRFQVSLFLVIIVGIMAGIFTATEAAAIAVMYTFIVAFFVKKSRNLSEYIEVIKRAVIDSASIYLLIAAAAIMSWVLSYYKALDPAVNYLVENDFSPTVFLFILMIIYVILGTFMEPNSAMLIIVPLSVP